MDYENIKKMAQEMGCKVADLFALARGNDPFYIGTPTELKLGQWFADIWQQHSYTHRVSLRRIHYRLFMSVPQGRKPDGSLYENDQKCWRILGKAARAARYLGLVDASLFNDKYNHQPIIYSGDKREELDFWVNDYVGSEQTRLPALPAPPDYLLSGYEARHPYFIEVWLEKSTMDEELMPVCKKYQVNLIAAKGEQSQTGIVNCIERVRRDGRPAVILYISDFDPAGRSIPLSAARKFEFFHSDGTPNISLVPIALTPQQCIDYDLPRNKIKKTEKRRGAFEKQFGVGATELDALEVKQPGALADIVRGAIESYRDPTLAARQRECEMELRGAFNDARNLVCRQHAVELDTLHRDYASIRDDIQERLEQFHTKRERVYRVMRDELEAAAPDLGDYPIPEPRPVRGMPDVLFSSDRDYMQQLAVYKEYQGKDIM